MLNRNFAPRRLRAALAFLIVLLIAQLSGLTGAPAYAGIASALPVNIPASSIVDDTTVFEGSQLAYTAQVPFSPFTIYSVYVTLDHGTFNGLPNPATVFTSNSPIWQASLQNATGQLSADKTFAVYTLAPTTGAVFFPTIVFTPQGMAGNDGSVNGMNSLKAGGAVTESIGVGSYANTTIAIDDIDSFAGGQIINFTGGSPVGTTPQTVTVNTPPFIFGPALAVGASVTVTGTATSGLPVALSSLTPTICSLAGNTVTGVSAGNCHLRGTQSGNATYAAAQGDAIFPVANPPAPQGISVTSPTPGQTLAVGSTLNIAAVAPSGLPLTLTSTTPAICTIFGTTVTGVAPGTCDIHVNQPGNAFYAPIQSDITFAVVPGPNTATLVSSTNPAAPGTKVTFTFSLNSSEPFSSPTTGTVKLTNNGVALANLTIGSNGSVSYTTSGLTLGAHNIAGTYTGDSGHPAATSNTVQQQISGATTTTTLHSSPNPSAPAQLVTFSASVSTSAATGSISFYDGNTLLGTSAITTGKATLQVSTLVNGMHNIAAQYSGDSLYAASTSAILVQTVSLVPKLRLTTSINPAPLGQSIAWTAALDPAAATGSVTFTEAGSVLVSAPVISGKAAVTIGTLAVGVHQIVANYSGDTNYAAVSSSILTQTVGLGPHTGFWWNPAEPGRGFVIEVQGSTMFMAGFLYDASGRATWVSSTGKMAAENAYQGALISYSGGQTLTGPYMTPVPAPGLGLIQLQFSSGTSGTLTWSGGTIPIQRYDIVAGGSSRLPAATTPQAGWWWNPAEGGRGFGLEVQGNQVYLTGYMYDTSGNPIWYLATGALSNSTTFLSVWQLYGGGETLTGPYMAPSLISADVGTLTLQFTAPDTATLTLPDGRQIPFVRFLFGM